MALASRERSIRGVMGDKIMKSYISSKVEIRESKLGGKGLFAKNKISKGEVVVDYIGGPGKFMRTKEADELYKKGNDFMIQVDNDMFFVATNNNELEEADFLNHSCDPNCGITGRLKIVATRDIESGEEITFDYAMTESSGYSIGCKCGSKNCRMTITGNDWKLPNLQKRYNGFFSEYIQKKLHKLE